MIKLQGKYPLTFPVTPGKISVKGYGNDTEAVTSITLITKNRATARRAKSISFEFVLPGDPESPIIEVDGYQGPRAWLNGLDLLTGAPALLTIAELDLAWNVIIGPCDGDFTGINIDWVGTIEFPIWIKDEFVTWSNNKQMLQPPQLVVAQQKARANTTGKTAKKPMSVINQSIQTIQRDRIQSRLTSLQQDRLKG